MSEKDLPILGDIKETMLGPLWARAKYSQIYPELLNDQKAIEIFENIDYDFSKIQEYLGEWRGLGLLVRAKSFDEALLQYIEKYPNATVVNIGAGLDTTFYRVDNGTVKWFDLDLPDAIEYRKKFLPESDRNTFISKSALDYSWFDDTKYSQENGIFFIAGGFIYYFKEEEISSLFNAMAEIFPDGEIVFDCISKLAVKVGNKRAKKAGIKTPFWHLAIGDPVKKISGWSDKLQVIDWFTIWNRTPINPSWKKKTRKMIKMAERFKTAKIVKVRFIK